MRDALRGVALGGEQIALHEERRLARVGAVRQQHASGVLVNDRNLRCHEVAVFVGARTVCAVEGDWMPLGLDNGTLYLDGGIAGAPDGERALALELAQDVLRDDRPQFRAHRAVLEHRHGDRAEFIRHV